MQSQLKETQRFNITFERGSSTFRNPYSSSTQLNFKRVSAVRFHLDDETTVDVPARAYIMLGRQVNNKDVIDVDLGEDGEKMGVSRNHAVVQVIRQDVTIRDFNSRNGTMLNDEKLYPMRDYPLHDGDEIVLGKVRLKVEFV